MHDQAASKALSKVVGYVSLNNFVAACGDIRDIQTVKKTLENHKFNIDGFDSNGKTALFCASNAGNIEAVKLLLKHGASVTATNRAGQTPHSVASDEIKKLLDDGLMQDRLNIRR